MLARCTPQVLSLAGTALLKYVGTAWTPGRKELGVFVAG